MRNNHPSRQAKPTYAFVVDGETEVWYLNMLKRNEPTIAVTLEPKLPSKKSIEEQVKLVESTAESYTKVFWIVDMDNILKEQRESKAKEKPLQKFERHYKRLHKLKNVEIVLNNPCLELWFLLHFERVQRSFSDCDSVGNALKKHLPDYTKTRAWFTRDNQDIYLRLKQHLPTAIQNAKAFSAPDTLTEQALSASFSQMQRVFELLNIA